MNTNTIVGIIVVIIVVIAGWFIFQGNYAPTTTGNTTPTTTGSTTGTTTGTSTGATATSSSAATVSFTSTGFSPNTVTIKQGQSVTWVNQSSENMWVASNVHPLHTLYNGTTQQQHCPDTTNSAFDECAAVPPGGRYTFPFSRTGTWGYHNHADPTFMGIVVVTQ